VQALPFFSWRRIASAKSYDFQLAADVGFHTIVADGAVHTRNTFASVDKSLADGTYHWRVRAVDASDRAGAWSTTRTLVKHWTQAPQLAGPAGGQSVAYPGTPAVLRWSAVPYASKYRVVLATDPQLANSALPATIKSPVETAATAFTVPVALAGGTYYWGVTPLDNEGHPGARSVVESFTWAWQSAVQLNPVTDLAPQAGAQAGQVFQPELSWQPVAGAARYQVEIGTSSDFASGSKVCCDQPLLATSIQPVHTLPNTKTSYWRVRAVDVDGNPGAWSAGTSFTEMFDPAHTGPSDATPVTVDHLRLADNGGELSVGATTAAPVARWDDVPGASSYEVQMGPYQGGGCDYAPSLTSQSWDMRTATTAFNPLAPARTASPTPAGSAYTQGVGLDGNKRMISGQAYCVRVRARSDRDIKGGDVVSGWTQLGGGPSFTYQAPLAAPARSPLQAVASDYHAVGSVHGMPVFTWDAIPGAASYWVVVAKDELLTDVVDVGLTNVPAYAPRSPGGQPKTYPDATDAYYWAVVPAANPDGSGTSGADTEDAPQSFHKISAPPAGPSVSMPAPGVQPRFAWHSVLGARSYRVQVSQDPGFGTLLDDVTTDSTAYTSSSTYPADSTLYWRVRANDETNVGLSWAGGPTLARRLSAPDPGSGNPSAGSAIPVLTWSPVAGATSYDLHVDDLQQGAIKDFTVRSTAFAPTKFTGVGVVHWSVRANFPKVPSGEVHGPYSDPRAFTRLSPPPANVHGANPRGGVVVSWDPAVQARRYRVEISASSAFTSLVESGLTETTSFAPKLNAVAYAAGGTLYWRVATIDEANSYGGYTAGQFALPRGLRVSATGSVRKGMRGQITVTVTTAKGKAVKSAQVKASGGGVRVSKRTGRQGTVVLRVRPRRRGTITLNVSRSGYTPGSATINVG
ncbi:MAG: hypothetical protein JWN32_3476, partial [Solirubrobacterales bacterium]|nr:hypothetical protein [Solirubrobacterales bacterium]